MISKTSNRVYIKMILLSASMLIVLFCVLMSSAGQVPTIEPTESPTAIYSCPFVPFLPEPNSNCAPPVNTYDVSTVNGLVSKTDCEIYCLAESQFQCKAIIWTYPVMSPAFSVGTCILSGGLLRSIPGVTVGTGTVCESYPCVTVEPSSSPTKKTKEKSEKALKTKAPKATKSTKAPQASKPTKQSKPPKTIKVIEAKKLKDHKYTQAPKNTKAPGTKKGSKPGKSKAD